MCLVIVCRRDVIEKWFVRCRRKSGRSIVSRENASLGNESNLSSGDYNQLVNDEDVKRRGIPPQVPDSPAKHLRAFSVRPLSSPPSLKRLTVFSDLLPEWQLNLANSHSQAWFKTPDASFFCFRKNCEQTSISHSLASHNKCRELFSCKRKVFPFWCLHACA